MSRILLLLSLLFAFAGPVYAAEPAAQAPAAAAPLDQPGMDTAALTSWISLAVADFMTYSHEDYERRLQQSSGYFTKAGWKSYTDALQKARVLESVAAQKQTVTAQVTSPPVIIQDGVLDGKFRWVISLPVTLCYKSAAASRFDPLKLTLVVERASEEDAPGGIGIVQFNADSAPDPSSGGNGNAQAVEYHPPGRLMASPVAPAHAEGPLDKPGLDGDALLAWTAAAATRAGNFGFVGYEEVFEKAKKGFTPQAWGAYHGQLVDSGMLKRVIESQQLVTVAPSTKPVIAHEEAKDGVYRWDVGMTLVRTLRVGSKTATTSVPLILTVTRTAEAPGIAISSWAEGPAAEMKPPGASSAPAAGKSTAGESPLGQPSMDNAALMSWVALAAEDFMTYSYEDYERRLQQSSGYFTKAGWQSFTGALQKYRLIESITAQRQSSNARIQSPPVVVQEGVLDGKYRWVVSLPVMLSCRGTGSARDDALRLTLVIERVSEDDTPGGIGIAQFIAETDPHGAEWDDKTAGNIEYHLPGRLMVTAPRNPADVPLDKPTMDGDTLLAWAAVAATRAGTFGFHNYEEKFSAPAKDFTPDAWKAYHEQLVQSGLLKSVVENQQIATVAPAARPVVREEGVRNGVYQWTVNITLVRTIRAGNKKATMELPVTLTVTRTATGLGVAISGWVEGK